VKKGRWTIILVPQGTDSSRQVELSTTTVNLIGTFGIAGLLIAMFLAYGTIAKSVDLSKARSVAAENHRLAQELGALQVKVGVLADTIATLEQHDAKIRLLANLDPIDPQVYAAGIGGPEPPHDSELSESVLLRQAGETRTDIGALLRRATLLAASFRQAADSLANHTQRLDATPSIMPTQGWTSSAFSAMRQHPILHMARPHEGVDISTPQGSPIEAPGGGRVTFAGWINGYGNVVTIDHGYGIVTKFAHASRLLVKVGQTVKRGDRIALVGNTGLSTGPHLHYEVHVNGKAVDPLTYVLPSVVTD
jgi:hypothetical protein